MRFILKVGEDKVEEMSVVIQF